MKGLLTSNLISWGWWNGMGVLREVFGPSKKEIWNELSNQINAEFQEKGIFGKGRVVAHAKEWTITLDTYTVTNGKYSTTYTRMRAPYVNKDGFWFKIYRAGFFSDVGALLGMKDIEVGFPEFDRDFVIKGNQEDKVKALFTNTNIRKLIELQPKFHLEVKNDEGYFGAEFPEGVDELYFRVTGVMRDIGLLKSLFDLFGEILDYLCVIGSAYEDNPRVIL
jgi:hypothetical protein